MDKNHAPVILPVSFPTAVRNSRAIIVKYILNNNIFVVIFKNDYCVVMVIVFVNYRKIKLHNC